MMSVTYPSRSLHGSIVHALGKRIVQGVYPAGSTLPVEDALREELNVSRNALREAIKVLSAKGLLMVKTRTGTHVLAKEKWHLTDPDVLSWALCGKVDKDFFFWLNEFRRTIEPKAAGLAAVRATEAQRVLIGQRMASLREVCLRGMSGDDDLEAYVDADMAFHDAIFEASANPFLQSVAQHIGGAMAKSRKLTHKVPGAEERALPLHEAVAEAIFAKDGPEAERAMLKIFDVVEGDLERVFTS